MIYKLNNNINSNYSSDKNKNENFKQNEMINNIESEISDNYIVLNNNPIDKQDLMKLAKEYDNKNYYKKIGKKLNNIEKLKEYELSNPKECDLFDIYSEIEPKILENYIQTKEKNEKESGIFSPFVIDGVFNEIGMNYQNPNEKERKLMVDSINYEN